MYNISICKKLTAKHYLSFEKGPEQYPHSHQYLIQVVLSGNKLDDHGFLEDIIKINRILNKIIKNFSNKTLNKMKEFKDKTPSIENFSKIIWDKFIEHLNSAVIETVEIKIWENENNWASYKGDIRK